MKNYKLAQEADKDRVYGALKEFTSNPKFWKTSGIDRRYCGFTEQGQEVIVDLMEDILRTVDVLERKALDQRAKEITFEALAGGDKNNI